MNSKFIKGLMLMAGVIFAALQIGDIVWASTIITMLCVGISYFVKNYLMPSDSLEGQLNWKNIVSAILLAIVTGIGDSVANLVVNGVVNWSLMWTTVVSVVLTYLGTTFFSGQLKK